MIIVIELSTILSGLAKDWVDFSRLGRCYLPEVVWREVEFLTFRAVTEKEEKIAREFMRFFPSSGWQIISDMSPLPAAANTPEGMDMSKKARLLTAIAETVYDLSLKNTDELIVLVTSETNLKTQLQPLEIKNLAIITPNQLKNWLKTGTTPPAVAEKLSLLPPQPQETLQTNSSHPRRLLQNTSSNVFFPATSGRRQRGENPLQLIGYTVSAIVFLLVAVGLTWYLVSPQSLQKFLPFPLPTNPRQK